MEFDESGETQQKYFKGMIYGGPGAGKTTTSLKIATAKRKTLIIDTERGSEPFRDEYRNPDGTPFLVGRTRSCEEVYKEAIPYALKQKCEFIILDQISSLWEDEKDSYIVKEYNKQSKAWSFIERNGKPPFQAWSQIKRPYRRMIRELLNAPIHVMIVARSSDEFKVSGEEITKVGEKAASEKDTPYEVAVLIKMEFLKEKKAWYALVEKDKWTTLAGEVFKNPTYSDFEPIFNKIEKVGKSHGALPELNVPEETASPSSYTEAQAKILSMLIKKGGYGEDKLEKLLTSLSTEAAASVINEMTVGDYTAVTNKKEE